MCMWFWKQRETTSLKKWKLNFCCNRGAARVTCRPVFMHGPPGPGPRAANFQGRHIKKIEIEVWYAEKKGCPRERNLREIYTENRRWHVLSFFGTIISNTKEQKLFGPISEYQHCTQDIPEYASNKLLCWTILFCSGKNQQLFTYILKLRRAWIIWLY